METPLLFYRQGGKNLNIKYIPPAKSQVFDTFPFLVYNYLN